MEKKKYIWIEILMEKVLLASMTPYECAVLCSLLVIHRKHVLNSSNVTQNGCISIETFS